MPETANSLLTGPGRLARIPSGTPVDAKLDSTISLHNQGVGVVKPELFSHPHATLPEQRTNFVHAHRLFRFQDFLGDRAGG